MERIFEPKTKAQAELVTIIKTNPDKRAREQAMKGLRTLFGVADYFPPYIRSIEQYSHIVGKPSYFRRFCSAVIYYDDTKIQL